jgi:hypothetical protein
VHGCTQRAKQFLYSPCPPPCHSGSSISGGSVCNGFGGADRAPRPPAPRRLIDIRWLCAMASGSRRPLRYALWPSAPQRLIDIRWLCVMALGGLTALRAPCTTAAHRYPVALCNGFGEQAPSALRALAFCTAAAHRYPRWLCAMASGSRRPLRYALCPSDSGLPPSALSHFTSEGERPLGERNSSGTFEKACGDDTESFGESSWQASVANDHWPHGRKQQYDTDFEERKGEERRGEGSTSVCHCQIAGKLKTRCADSSQNRNATAGCRRK